MKSCNMAPGFAALKADMSEESSLPSSLAMALLERGEEPACIKGDDFLYAFAVKVKMSRCVSQVQGWRLIVVSQVARSVLSVLKATRISYEKAGWYYITGQASAQHAATVSPRMLTLLKEGLQNLRRA